jgi:hypothetical protein
MPNSLSTHSKRDAALRVLDKLKFATCVAAVIFSTLKVLPDGVTMFGGQLLLRFWN